jgi:hypothetical protein
MKISVLLRLDFLVNGNDRRTEELFTRVPSRGKLKCGANYNSGNEARMRNLRFSQRC